MNKIILVGIIVVLAACSNNNGAETVPPVTQDQEAKAVQTSTNTNSEQAQAAKDELSRLDNPDGFRESSITSDQARMFASELLKKINSYQQVLEDAFELGEKSTLQNYSLNIIPNEQQSVSQKLDTKNGEVHIWCDTALNSLGLYAGVLERQLGRDTAEGRQFVRDRLAYLNEYKEKCKNSIGMTPEQARAAYEAEFGSS